MKKFLAVLVLVVVIVFSFLLISSKFDNLNSALGSIFTGVSEKIENRNVEILGQNFNGRYNYYYNSLDDDQKYVYSIIYDSYNSFAEDFTVNVDAEIFNTINNAVLYDNPDIFWVEPIYSYKDFNGYIIVTPTYRNSPESIEKIKNDLDNKVNEIYEMAQKLQTDYQKELFIHDYICSVAEYDQSTYDTIGDTAYSALINGKTICEGYCRAFKLVLDKCGIKNYMVVGIGETMDGTEGHMWSVVNIDSENYYVDITWDDGDESLVNTTHLYFNMDELEISKEHKDIVPDNNNCNGIMSNYFHKTGMYLTELDLQSDSFIDSCVNQLDNYGIIELKFSDANRYNEFMDMISESDREIFNALKEINAKSQKNITTNTVHYIHNDYYLYVCLIFDEVS